MSAARIGQSSRATRETQIDVTWKIDGTGIADIDTGIPFFDHMLTALAMHGRFNLSVHAKGDLEVSQHHTVEDVGIVMGQAFAQALGDKAGIVRYGHCLLPMDEALVRVVLDLSGRAFVDMNIDWVANLGPVGFDYRLTSEFLWGFARAAHVTIHADSLKGANNHHMCEATFKGLARSLDMATWLDSKLGGAVPSTKGGFDG